jgi:hypothetical protein
MARRTIAAVIAAVTAFAGLPGTAAHAKPAPPSDPRAVFTTAAASDTTAPLRDLAARARAAAPRGAAPAQAAAPAQGEVVERPERGAVPADNGYTGDAALPGGPAATARAVGPRIPSTRANFEGIRNTDNPFLVSPPDPNGEVGPNHYVEMVNLMFAVYAKDGTTLVPPTPIGALWADFDVPDCTDLSGDPVVLYDQISDRWLLTQFTTAGPTFYNCVAISATPDPTGAYHRYAFSSGPNFPDYPKYGVWPNAYFLSTREFAPDNSFAGVGAYALERKKMIQGRADARMVRFEVPPGTTPWIPGDGLLPSDFDGKKKPPDGSPNYFVGTQDNGGPYGAPFDALNIFQFWVSWGSSPTAAFFQSAQVPVAEFDSVFPCDPPPNTRDCIPQPGTPNKLDILSYRQRPTFRLAYRNFGSYESLVTNQSVEARPGVAGVRWYEIRRPGDSPLLWQQSTYAPNDGVHRWMGSVAQDRKGNMALGFSVSSSSVFPGIRYTGRLRDDPANTMPQGEAVLRDGTGSMTVSSRWGDYTDLTVDPTDDCTFWYVNQYIETTGPAFWQTRIGSFRLPGCA